MLETASQDGEWATASIGTDGSDFLPYVAGALVNNQSLKKPKVKNLDVLPHISRYDSNTLLKRGGHSLIFTGCTGTNIGYIIACSLKGNVACSCETQLMTEKIERSYK